MRRALPLFAVLGLLSLAGCAADTSEPETGTSEEELSENDAVRLRWVRFVRAQIAPRLYARGVSETHVRRAVWFALSEGIFTIAKNGGYARRGGAQSPVGFSNCGDAPSVNRRTALPDCFGAEGYAFRSGNWQVGIAGAQVSDAFVTLPGLYRELYGDLRPKDLARDVMVWLGEDPETFPDLELDALVCASDPSLACKRRNARWVSVVLRDPTLSVYVQTKNGWVRDLGRSFGYGKDIVDRVFSEAARPRASIVSNGLTIDGPFARAFREGLAGMDCFDEALEPCIAALGLPIGAREAKDLPIPGAAGRTRATQRFERSVLVENVTPDGTRIEGALLGGQGHPEVPVDPLFRGYVARYGGLRAFGYPTGPAVNRDGRRVQTFERARLEATSGFDPNRTDPVWQVLRGHLGREQR